MKKVCFIASNLNNNGGTERVGTELANHLAEKGYNILFINIAGGDDPFFKLHPSVKNISLFPKIGRVLYRTPSIIYRLRKALKKEEVDVVIDIEAMKVLFTLPASIGLSMTRICWEHFNFKNVGHPGRKVARQLAALYYEYVVTLTERDKQDWLNGTRHNSQIVVIPNPSPFEPQNIVQNKTNKTVLAVGRLVHVKGFDLLLNAWAQVAEAVPDWKLVIVGDGEEKDNLIEIINDRKLNNNVELVGRTDDVGSYYRNADILCLSSRFEGLPMVLIEGLAYGLPVVSFDCHNGPAEILENTGSTLVPQGDINQLAVSLINMIRNEEGRKEISLKSLEKSKQYDPSKIVQEWIKLIES